MELPWVPDPWEVDGQLGGPWSWEEQASGTVDDVWEVEALDVEELRGLVDQWLDSRRIWVRVSTVVVPLIRRSRLLSRWTCLVENLWNVVLAKKNSWWIGLARTTVTKFGRLRHLRYRNVNAGNARAWLDVGMDALARRRRRGEMTSQMWSFDLPIGDGPMIPWGGGEGGTPMKS